MARIGRDIYWAIRGSDKGISIRAENDHVRRCESVHDSVTLFADLLKRVHEPLHVAGVATLETVFVHVPRGERRKVEEHVHIGGMIVVGRDHVIRTGEMIGEIRADVSGTP